MNHIKYRFLFLFIGFNLFASITTTATIPNPPVKYLGIEQGLSNNAVTCILQDDYGFMWMGTYSGLNRFDGSNFLHYNSIWGDENSIASNHITHLAQNNAHQIWVGTQKGVVYFDYEEAKFSPVYYQTATSRKKIKISSSINGLVSGRKGEMYIATADMGLLVYDPKIQSSFQVVFNHKISNYNVQTIMLDHKDKLWLFIKDIGLCKYNAVNKSITVINSTLKTAACLKEDHKNQLWIGTQSGLYKFNTISGILSQHRSPKFTLSGNNIQDLHISKNKLWIATNGGGINILDLETKKLDYILAGESEGLLKSSAVSAIYEDKESRKWIATLRGGVNIIENNLQSFQVIKHDPLNKNSLINNFTLSFCEDENNNLWIGTDGGGLSFYDNKAQKYVNFTADTNKPGSLSSNFVVSILNDHKSQIWVAAFNGGVDLYNKKTKKFKHYNLYNPKRR